MIIFKSIKSILIYINIQEQIDGKTLKSIL